MGRQHKVYKHVFFFKLNLFYLEHCLLECSAMSETLQKTWEASATVKFVHVVRVHKNTMECGKENRERTPNSGFYKANCVICNENSTEKPLEMVP